MTRRHIAQRLSDECGLLVMHADKVIGSLTEIIVQEILKGELELPGVGKFEVRWTKTMIGRNPLKPSIEIEIPPRPKIFFKPTKDLADRVIKTLAVVASKK